MRGGSGWQRLKFSHRGRSRVHFERGVSLAAHVHWRTYGHTFNVFLIGEAKPASPAFSLA